MSFSSQHDLESILLNRRDLMAYGDILSELKGKTMGGRMRYGVEQHMYTSLATVRNISLHL
uniref:DUF4277 domain-containing protein n=1 Tax=Angiostrongylus cantonensis TaxID=6313 RepID=A0A0K0DCQ0_ANGCA